MAAPVHDIVALLAALGMANTTRNQLLPIPFPVSAKTANYTISPSQAIDPCGTIFTNRGAAGAVTFTLPIAATVPPGTWYLFLGVADQNIVIASSPADTLLATNDAAADSVAFSTAMQKIGALGLAISDGTQFAAFTIAVGITGTIAT